MLCLVTDLHCDPEGQASALAAWPKPLRQLGGKQDANSHPTLRGEEAAASLEDRDQPDYAAWEIGECGGGGVTGAYSSPLRPVNQGTTSQTRSGGGVERNSCQETSGDTATAAVWPWLWRSTRGAYELLPRLRPWPPAPKPPPTHPSRAKSLPPPRALGLRQHVCTDLICSIKLQRTPCHISLQRSRPRGAEVKSGARKTRSPLTWQRVYRGNPSISTNYHDGVRGEKKKLLSYWVGVGAGGGRQGNDVLWLC